MTYDVGLVEGADLLVRALGLVVALNGRDRAARCVRVVDVAGRHGSSSLGNWLRESAKCGNS